jgi:hypothetical protein
MRKLHMGVLAAICLAAAFVLASRVTAQAEYRTEATIAPGTQAHQYVVHVSWTDRHRSKSSKAC